MSTAAASSIHRIVVFVSIAVSFLSVALLTYGFFQHAWLIDAAGQFTATDFLNVYAAGTLAMDGHAAVAYDWNMHRLAEIQVLGHEFKGYFGWHYPPPFLFVAQLLARVPYLVAFALWVGIGSILYGLALRLILGTRLALFTFFAVPAVLWNITLGQNGLLTAAFMGVGAWSLSSRPVLAGICFGLLSYKPQFGLLLPLLLLLEKRWKVIGVATVTTIVMGAGSVAVFGIESWQASLHWMPMTAQKVLVEGTANFAELQSVMGAARWLGMGVAEALALHAVVACGMFVLAYHMRRHATEEMCAAILVLLLLFSTPYVYIYDLVALGIVMALCVRRMIYSAALPYECVGLLVAVLLLFMGPMLEMPLGFAAMLILLALTIRRGYSSHG